MLPSLLIVFREVFEAGLIIGIVMAVTAGVAGRGRWVAGGVAAGVLGACVVALFTGGFSSSSMAAVKNCSTPVFSGSR